MTTTIVKEANSNAQNAQVVHVPSPNHSNSHTSIVGLFPGTPNTVDQGVLAKVRKARSHSFNDAARNSIDLTNIEGNENFKKAASLLQEKSLGDGIRQITIVDRTAQEIAPKLRHVISGDKYWNAEIVAKAIALKIPSNDRKTVAIIGEALALTPKNLSAGYLSQNPEKPIESPRQLDTELSMKVDQIALAMLVKNNCAGKDEECLGVVCTYAEKCSTAHYNELLLKIKGSLQVKELSSLAQQAFQWELEKVSQKSDVSSEEDSLLRGESLGESLSSRAVALPELKSVIEEIKVEIDKLFACRSVDEYLINEKKVIDHLKSLKGFTEKTADQQKQLIDQKLQARSAHATVLVETILSKVYTAKLSDKFVQFLKERRQIVNKLFPKMADQMISNLVFLRVINPNLIEAYKADPAKLTVISSVCSLVQSFCNGCEPNGELQTYKKQVYDKINKSLADKRDNFFKELQK